jgi:hypothetical protein
VRRWHADVDDRDIRVLIACELEKAVCIICLPNDVEPGALEEDGQALAKQKIVVS